MGAACCVAARDKTIQSGSTSDILHRNVRCSPTWSFRWDHRGRVAGEDISINWFSDGISRNDGSENKNESAYVSEDGSPLQNYQRKRFQQSPISEATAVRGRNSTSGKPSEFCLLVLNIKLLGLDFSRTGCSLGFFIVHSTYNDRDVKFYYISETMYSHVFLCPKQSDVRTN